MIPNEKKVHGDFDDDEEVGDRDDDEEVVAEVVVTFFFRADGAGPHKAWPGVNSFNSQDPCLIFG